MVGAAQPRSQAISSGLELWRTDVRSAGLRAGSFQCYGAEAAIVHGEVRSSHADAYLAEVLAAGEMLQRRGGLIELEDAVDYRTQSTGADGAVHILEHLAGADPNAHDVRGLEQNPQ